MKRLLPLLLIILVCACGHQTENREQKTENGERKNLSFPLFNADSAYAFVKAQTDFGVSTSMAKVQIVPGDDSLPYQVGLYHFKDNAGLWFLAGCETEELAEELEPTGTIPSMGPTTVLAEWEC